VPRWLLTGSSNVSKQCSTITALQKPNSDTHLCSQACVGWLVLCVDAQTKVSQLDAAVSCQQHILQLDIPASRARNNQDNLYLCLIRLALLVHEHDRFSL
jgi:hypothetical protein